jgi:acyl-CoA synthetase (AMP-forming)/AMP-acid ligase II
VAIEVDGGDNLTHGEWAARSAAVARGLSSLGVEPGDRVALRFDRSRWADFAVAYAGVRRAGAVAVLVSPGMPTAGVARCVSHADCVGIVASPSTELAGFDGWTYETRAVEDASDERDDARLDVVLLKAVAPGDLIYPPDVLAAPRPFEPRPHAPVVDAPIVHAWAPGSAAGQEALFAAVRRGRAAVVTLAGFDADRLCALASERGAPALGLTPALAAALLASGALHRNRLAHVRRIVLSAPPSPALRTALADALPTATVLVLASVDGRPEGRTDSAPASVSQAPMVWHEQLAPASFNLPALVRRYQGPLDVDAMRRALAELRRRHEPLRTTFEVVDGGARHVVHAPDDGAAVPVVDLSLDGPDGRRAAVDRLLADASAAPFDLAAGPLFEPRLVRLGPDDHLLVVRLHHTTFDDWSVDVFRRELSALYTAAHDHAPAPRAEPGVTFSGFARRERMRLDGGEGAAQLAWWRRELEGAPLAVQLPIGPAPPGGTDPIRLDLDPTLVAALRAVAPRLRATPYMTVLAAFDALVAHDTGLDDVVVASVVAHRNRTELEPLIGCFTKKIPVRVRLDGRATFAELVVRARTALLGALAHQDVGFDEAIEAALGEGASAHGVVPQVNVVFQAETPRHAALSLPGVAISAYEPPAEARRERHFTAPRNEGPARPAGNAPWGDGAYLGTFLILSLAETGAAMTLIARGSFDGDAVSRWLDRLVELLGAALADPARRWPDLVPGGAVVDGGDPDVLDVRGFRVRRSRVEAALARCAGVADAAVAVRHEQGRDAELVAYVVPDDPKSPPSLGSLRAAMWSTLPGVPWPAAVLNVASLPRRADGRADRRADERVDGERRGAPGVLATILTAMWRECGGRAVAAQDSYRHDFSFLAALVEARAAGIEIPSELVARCRTPEMLAAAVSTVVTQTAVVTAGLE